MEKEILNKDDATKMLEINRNNVYQKIYEKEAWIFLKIKEAIDELKHFVNIDFPESYTEDYSRTIMQAFKRLGYVTYIRKKRCTRKGKYYYISRIEIYWS